MRGIRIRTAWSRSRAAKNGLVRSPSPGMSPRIGSSPNVRLVPGMRKALSRRTLHFRNAASVRACDSCTTLSCLRPAPLRQGYGGSAVASRRRKPRALLSQQLTDRLEILDVIANGLDHHHHRHCEDSPPDTPDPAPEEQ